MSNEVNVSIDIDAPPEAVFDLMLDPDRLQDWVTIHRKLCAADAGPPREGSKMKQRLVLRGAPFTVNWELVACDRPRHAQWNGKGPARSKAETEYTLTQLPGGGTRFAYRNEFKAPLGPLGAVAGNALVGGLPEKEATASLQKLKKLLESPERS